jgi:hypothetical protein
MVSSLIKITNAPLSYHPIRSVYTHKERFDQTIETIESVQKNIPNSYVCLIDCSYFTQDEIDILNEKCDIIINLYDDLDMRKVLRYSKSKSLCEALQTLSVIEFIKKYNIKFKNFFKITGRYKLNEDFNYELYNNNMNVGRIQSDMQNYFVTSFYKLTPQSLYDLERVFNIQECKLCLHTGTAYEEIFKFFMALQPNTKYLESPIGIDEYISVNGQFRKQ